jgi:hypothetical protein
MKITGKIEFISALETGTSKNGNPFEKAYIVINDEIGQYPNRYKVELLNKTELMRGVSVGSRVSVQVNGNVNEYQGKHYASLMMYKLDIEGATPAPAPVPVQAVPMPAPVQTASDDLPF